ncbi:MAG: metal ABC transporter ATP-binding protein [Oscillospiraceae bacterium]|nr:metal ABC transporter ATP-binding protein [Oscillospiraceae bacterium]
MALISCRDLCLAYEGRIAVSSLSFDVLEGDYICIVGENGSGKSTLIKALLGLKKPVSGEIVYSDGLKKTEIGYLPQQTPAQKDFPASVGEVVLSGCRGAPFHTRAEKRSAAENMELMGITDLKKACYRELSGGQQQRVLLARALCATKKLLLLDEPVTGLDPLVSAGLYRLIQRLNDGGVTVIMVSHDVDCAIERAKKILHLQTVPLFWGSSCDYADSETGRRFMGDAGDD